MGGKVLLTINVALETGVYKEASQFVPTEVAVDTNGDFFIADGYGAQYVLHYDKDGKLKSFFGGRGEGDEHFDNAHGNCIDSRNPTPTLLVTDRTRNCLSVSPWMEN
jgi:hypothetical protein